MWQKRKSSTNFSFEQCKEICKIYHSRWDRIYMYIHIHVYIYTYIYIYIYTYIYVYIYIYVYMYIYINLCTTTDWRRQPRLTKGTKVKYASIKRPTKATYIWKETYCYYYRSASEIDELHKRDMYMEKTLSKVTYTYEKWPTTTSTEGLLSKIDTLYAYIYEKRPTKETYKKTYKRDQRKSPTKETYKRDLPERTTKRTYTITWKREIHKTHMYLRETYKTNVQIEEETYCFALCAQLVDSARETANGRQNGRVALIWL